ncbi:hypothetical protein ACVI1N_002462 [Sinorhizobium medicae]
MHAASKDRRAPRQCKGSGRHAPGDRSSIACSRSTGSGEGRGPGHRANFGGGPSCRRQPRLRRPACLCGRRKLRTDGHGGCARAAGHLRHSPGTDRHSHRRRGRKPYRSCGRLRGRYGACALRCPGRRHRGWRLFDFGIRQRLHALCNRRCRRGQDTRRAYHRHGQQCRRTAAPGRRCRNSHRDTAGDRIRFDAHGRRNRSENRL